MAAQTTRRQKEKRTHEKAATRLHRIVSLIPIKSMIYTMALSNGILGNFASVEELQKLNYSELTLFRLSTFAKEFSRGKHDGTRIYAELARAANSYIDLMYSLDANSRERFEAECEKLGIGENSMVRFPLSNPYGKHDCVRNMLSHLYAKQFILMHRNFLEAEKLLSMQKAFGVGNLNSEAINLLALNNRKINEYARRILWSIAPPSEMESKKYEFAEEFARISEENGLSIVELAAYRLSTDLLSSANAKRLSRK
ncbi:MAG: hypothetical protein QXN59_02210 [Candidatus Micrarchaeaceae archaeon]